MYRPASLADLQSLIRVAPRWVARGGGSKSALSSPAEGETVMELSGLAGVLEYDPGEFTFTALAGTRVADVQNLLAEHGQYLPFDPPLVSKGATLGGTVASGLSGAGRYRYGGVRDFILGVQWVNGEGQLVRAGGKVVKNAAGFDLPKLFVGSCGQLGLLTELAFKVFPKPQAYATLRVEFRRLPEALEAVYKQYRSQMDLESLEVRPDARSVTVYVRLGGLREALPARLDRLAQLLGGGEILEGGNDVLLWQGIREFEWANPEVALVKVPLTPAKIAALDVELEKLNYTRRYSAGGQVAYIAGADNLSGLHALLAAQNLSGQKLFGSPIQRFIGASRSNHTFASKVKQALDKTTQFGALAN
ncbi:MAG: FAD-binding protein [Anaerolineales bacterium]|nr:FAD-binding protein [Anaerolineales bacterium]